MKKAYLLLVGKLEYTDKKKNPPTWLYPFIAHPQYVRILVPHFCQHLGSSVPFILTIIVDVRIS